MSVFQTNRENCQLILTAFPSNKKHETYLQSKLIDCFLKMEILALTHSFPMHSNVTNGLVKFFLPSLIVTANKETEADMSRNNYSQIFLQNALKNIIFGQNSPPIPLLYGFDIKKTPPL